MTEIVLAAAPSQARLGWSLGGLVASRAALMQPQRVKGLITVASSPCFAARDEWPGIRPDVLSGFQHQLSTISSAPSSVFWRCRRWAPKRASGCAPAESGGAQPADAERRGVERRVEILRTADLRALAALELPLLRIYGYLDGLVPRKVAELLDAASPNSTSQLVAKAAHAPFISHPDEFVTMIEAFIAAH